MHAVLRRSGPPLVLVMLAVVAYHEVVSYAYVGNDFFALLHTATQEPLFLQGQFEAYYRPVLYAVFALEYGLTGLLPETFQVTTLLLHAVAAVLVYVTGRDVLAHERAGIAAATVFLLHPATMTVLPNPVLRPEILTTIFFLIAILFLDTYRRTRGVLWLAGSVSAALLAYLSKEAAVVLAGIVVLYLWHARTDLGLRRCTHVFVLHVAALGVYLMARMAVLPHPFGLERTYNMFPGTTMDLVMAFGRGLVAPFQPVAFPVIPLLGSTAAVTAVLGVVVVIAVTAVAGRQAIRGTRQRSLRSPPVLPFAGWILGSLALYVVVGRMSTWYAYPVIAPLALLFAYYACTSLSGRAARAVIGVVVVYGILTTPLVMEYASYQQSGEMLQGLVPEAVRIMEAVPDHSDVVIVNLFAGVDGMMFADGLPGYSFMRLLGITHPEREWNLYPVNRVHVRDARTAFSFGYQLNRTADGATVTVGAENVVSRDVVYGTRAIRRLNATTVRYERGRIEATATGDQTYLLLISGDMSGPALRLVNLSRS